ncbi:3-keto-5-aminohexanoate cleavage protein [Pseudodonghicola flavimaris]|uniref:3-keto-5-aminohexanoate cleavage protein n=1 Tax=Pseudodonghicola flavimaris TaxID=3050036 RepID=A0ABT7F695_9RHOB|nr:3-keto-5-aminohexanoate cleavage protein [Pseudodonghicola flavimaris]MDK3020131.1 3-keto-5-aminohexanoate cleavage protein [Pseudodonghicola flavimaris]
MTLPRLMVAPNGATKSKADHPALPIALEEITAEARACLAAGAGALHLHLRDDAGGHLLDSGAYAEALTHLAAEVPGLALQITTEAAGLYHPAHQRYVALHSGATMVSVALRENIRDSGTAARRFYECCAERGIAVQHILYDRADAEVLTHVLPPALLRDRGLQLLFVLGRYTAGQQSDPGMLAPFLDWVAAEGLSPDWAVCAFGQGETACLVAAAQRGGKCRVGFENALVHPDGQRAGSNAERVTEVTAALAGAGLAAG